MQNELRADQMENITQLIGKEYDSFRAIENDVVLFFGGCDHVETIGFRDGETTQYKLNGKTVEIKYKPFKDGERRGIKIANAYFA